MVSMYFQTLLRIWDCFLLEGPKVLFRFALAILKLHEKDILQKTDTMGIMKHLKACAKLTYDVEGLVKVGLVLCSLRQAAGTHVVVTNDRRVGGLLCLLKFGTQGLPQQTPASQ